MTCSCVLQVQDLLMRVRGRRFASIDKDMAMALAHCGSLFLDPATLCQAE
jgi:protein arginine N-methyltransferase 7